VTATNSVSGVDMFLRVCVMLEEIMMDGMHVCTEFAVGCIVTVRT